MALNSRARMPQKLKAYCGKHTVNPRTFLSVNPKTEKSEVQTYILHLAPADLSGFNVCAGAGNCRKVCLHFAGNPAQMSGKTSCRIRRTLAYVDDAQLFLDTLVSAILCKRLLHPIFELLAFRLNGTSDIPFERIPYTVTEEMSRWWYIKFGVKIYAKEYASILHMFAEYPELNIVFYDYTKIRRDWQECRNLGYHLTFSFDGWDNKANLKLCMEAWQNCVNIAAAFNLKKSQPLPAEISIPGLNLPVARVYDGDKSDFRPSDPAAHIVGLKFKLPHGVKYTEAEKTSFCIL